MHVWRCSFRSSSEQLQDQFSHRDSDWPRFLYDSLSLCEHPATTDIVSTLTVIMSSIFSLDSTDGQSEISLRSTATESRWSSWLKGACSINQEFRSFSRFLWVPVESMLSTITAGWITVKCTGYSDWLSSLSEQRWGLSHCHLPNRFCQMRKIRNHKHIYKHISSYRKKTTPHVIFPDTNLYIMLPASRSIWWWKSFLLVVGSVRVKNSCWSCLMVDWVINTCRALKRVSIM